MRRRLGESRGMCWQRGVLSIGVVLYFSGNPALANPTGPVVTQGQATVATQGNTLTVTNTPGTVINWQGFSIAGNEITRFIQQSQSSNVLNRVVGINPSELLGTLQSNGRVFLVNPNGITIGPGANIDVAGFLASTLNLSDGDFLAGRMRFTETPGAGSVVNQGAITTATGGMVYLVGTDVQNSGIIRSPQGEIMLAAGKSIELVDAQTPEVRVQVSAPDNQALNLGQLIAAGGRIGMYGTLVQNSGLVNANTAVMGENGKIVFKAVKDVTLDAGSVVTANGPDGGRVTAQAETGTLLAAGTIEAKGEAGKGGTVELLGTQVGLIGSASVDVSGQAGGGTALVGGDFQGSNPDVQNSGRTYFGPDATVRADAIQQGDGGKVIIWSDDITRFYGNISARGGAQNGDGGFAEVSGKEFLVYRGTTDLSAPAGDFGTLLLDPRDITIQASGLDNNQLTAGVPSGEVAGQIRFGATTSTNFTLTAGTVSASAANVVLQAQRDININAAVTLQNDVDFVAQAGHDINVNAALTTNGVSAGKGRIHLEADSPHSGTFFDGVGQVKIGSTVNSCGGAAGGCAGGKVTLIGGGNSSPNGGFTINSTVQAGNGGIDVALSQTTADLNFFIGAGGNTQLSSKDTGSLKTTGALVLGRATTGGTDGLGSGATTLTVNSITNATATPIQLSADSGSSFELYAGSGGITLSRPLTTYQNTVINTTGTLTINETLATSNNNLTLSVGSVELGGSWSVNIGSGSCTGTACTTLGVNTSQIFWDGEAGDFNWFNPINWRLSGSNPNNVLPSLIHDVTIDTTAGFGTIQIGTIGLTAQAKSLVAGRPVVLSSGALELANASNFSDALTFSGGTLQGTGSVVVSGPAGSLAWSSGIMASGGDFLLGSGRSGTLSGATLSLNRLFQNDGTLTLSGATIGGTGSIANAGSITVTGLLNAINVPLVNTVNTSPGTIQVNVNGSLTAANFFTNDGQIKVGNGATFSTGINALANTPTSSVEIEAGNYITAGPTVTTTGGNLAVSGALSAGSIKLLASGSVTLNLGSSVTATGSTVDSIVISGASFTNNAGSGALNAGAGRYLVWSSNSNPFAGGTPDDRGGLAYNFKQYNATYGSTAVLGAGNGFLYTLAPTITPGLQGTVTKTYDGLVAAALAAGNFKTSGIGEVDGDTVVLSNPATGVYANANAGSGKGVTASSASSLSSATNGLATVYGYQVSGTPASGNVGTINPAALTISTNDVTKVYDGTLGMSGATGQGAVVTSGTLYTNVSNGNVLDSLSGGTFAYTNANAGTSNKTVTVSGVTVSDGNLGGNYNVTYADNTTSTINPAVISIAGSRAYDGSTTFGPGAFGTINGVNGETLTVASGSGTVASPTVSAGTQSLALGTLALGNGSGLAGNYTLAGGTHSGTILVDPGNFLWVSGSGGNWDAGANWNQGVVPVTNAVVTIPDVGAAGLSDVVTYRSASGTTSIKSLTSAEALSLTGGTLNLGAAVTDVSSIPQVTLAGGTLGGSGKVHVATLNLLAAGLLNGNGTFVGNVNNTSGTVAPGASAGTLTIDGNYVQGPSGTLAMELGGVTPGTQYDQLVITGNATLDGTLNVSLINGYVPATGENFRILQGSAVSGTFATTNLPVTTSTMSAEYLASSVNLTTSPNTTLNTEQLVAVQVNTANNATPSTNVVLNTVNTSATSGLTGSAYLETGGGQIVALTPTDVPQTGVYTNVETGESTILGSGTLPAPGVYLSADGASVVVIVQDPESGALSVMTGSSGGVAVGGQARVSKPGVCK